MSLTSLGPKAMAGLAPGLQEEASRPMSAHVAAISTAIGLVLLTHQPSALGLHPMSLPCMETQGLLPGGCRLGLAVARQ